MRIKSKYIKVFIFTLSTLVFFLPQMSTFYYVFFLDAYGLTNAQAGTLLSVYGMTSLPAYLFGGLMADKFNAKKLIIISCFATGGLGILMTFVSSYYILLPIYVIFGFTTTFLQWSALCKIIRSMGSEREQGKLFGSMEMSNAIIGAACLYGVLAALGTLMETTGFKVVTSIFGILLIISGILITVLCDDPSAGIKTNDFDFKSVGKVLKHPVVWLNGFIVLGMYILNTSSSYISPYLSEVVGIPISLAVGLQIAAVYVFNAIFCPIGGAAIDRLHNTTPVLLTGAAVCVILVCALIVIGPTAAPGLIIAVVLLFYIGFNTSKPCMYTPVPEGGVPIEITGTAVGIVSTIGYSSDIWLYTLCGTWLDKHGDAGYNRIWGLIIAGMIISAIAGILFQLYKNRHKEEIEEAYRHSAEIEQQAMEAENA
ncbi:MFS transporter [bacterium 210820-DFI.6.37]|nr:MFS transporter [bacterium 210820-DFI.6.37]